jgi:hypothetical protein
MQYKDQYYIFVRWWVLVQYRAVDHRLIVHHIGDHLVAIDIQQFDAEHRRHRLYHMIPILVHTMMGMDVHQNMVPL